VELTARSDGTAGRVAWRLPDAPAGGARGGGIWLTLPATVGGRSVRLAGGTGGEDGVSGEQRELISLGGTRWLAVPIRGQGEIVVEVTTPTAGSR